MDYQNNNKENNMFAEYPDLLGFKQVREMLKIGNSLTYRLLRNNIIKNKKIGRAYIIFKKDVIDYLTSS